jgi:S-formylglutathione hydrolase FrmB
MRFPGCRGRTTRSGARAVHLRAGSFRTAPLRPGALRTGRWLTAAAAAGVLFVLGCTGPHSAPAGHTRAAPTRSPRPSAGRRSRAGRRRPQPAAPPAPARQIGAGGDLEIRPIPGRTVHYAARPATIWLPPVLRRRPQLRLPVLILLHGTPGGPADWVERGGLRTIADRFAAAHGGRAPIMVMPDVNGAAQADTECIRTPRSGDVFGYLQRVVPAWIAAHLPAERDRIHWAIGGLSAGGTCAATQAMNRPSAYRAFVDLAGLEHPTLGRNDDPRIALRDLFDGSRSDFDEHDPLWLARHRDLRGLAAWFECGRSDAAGVRAQALVAASARRSGAEVHAAVVAGGHEWAVWTAALTQALPWLWARVDR